MKGLATQTIVLLILALIVLGILAGLVFIGGGPFRTSAEYNTCKGRLITWCTSGGTYQTIMGGSEGVCIKTNWASRGYNDIFPDNCDENNRDACCKGIS